MLTWNRSIFRQEGLGGTVWTGWGKSRKMIGFRKSGAFLQRLSHAARGRRSDWATAPQRRERGEQWVRGLCRLGGTNGSSTWEAFKTAIAGPAFRPLQTDNRRYVRHCTSSFSHWLSCIDRSARLIRRYLGTPDRDAAGRYIIRGNYLWNRGMFSLQPAEFWPSLRNTRLKCSRP